VTFVLWAEATGRSHTAIEASREPDPAVAPPETGPGAYIYHLRGYALHHLGRYQEQLQVAREIERRWPPQVAFARTQELMALAALGYVDTLLNRLARWEATPESEGFAGNRALIAGLELMAHGHEREGRELIAGTVPSYRRLRELGEGYGSAASGELTALEVIGSFAEARSLAHAALKASTNAVDSVTYLAALGSLAADEGKRVQAARYGQLLRALEPNRDDRDAPFHRAQIEARLGDREGAVRLLERARAEASSASWHVTVHRDLAFVSLRDYPPFQRFLEPRD
jgi:tetratricopeptide (TPR) repeat protein